MKEPCNKQITTPTDPTDDEAHPLFPVIVDWAKNAPRALVSFALPEGFQDSIDRAAKLDHRLGHEYAKAQVWRTYIGAAALGKILVGSRFDMELHSMIYHAATGSPLAFALCDAAMDACKFGAMARTSFYVASHLDGFLNALEAWAWHFEYNVEFSGPDKLPFILREIVEKNAVGDQFWLSACQADFPNALSFTKKLSDEHLKLQDAKRKRSERGTKRDPAGYRDCIAWGWLPLSLWARSAAGISCLLNPKQNDGAKAEGRVRRDISSLKFSKSHRGDHQKVFEIGQEMKLGI